MSLLFRKTLLISFVSVLLFLYSPIPAIFTTSNIAHAQFSGTSNITQDVAIPCYDEDVDGYVAPIADVKLFPKNPIKWFVCAIGQVFAEGIDFLNLMTQRLLLFDPTKSDAEAELIYADCTTQTGDDSCAGSVGLQGDGTTQLRKLWGNVLTIANILLVIAFLVMTVSTALDLGVFSNYTVKKMLPRIFIAAFTANLSWSLCALIISMVNFVGIGMQQFLTAPFAADLNANIGTAIQNSQSSDALVGVRGGVMLGIGVFMYLVLSSGGSLLLVFGAVGLVAAMIAMAIVLVRRVILILLVVFSPLAFMMWAFPGGEGLFKKWWKTFSTMLLVFPFAMALFSGGIIVATIMSSAGGLNITGGSSANIEELITGVVIFSSLIAPYALLPTTFKLAGGVIGKLGGIANDRSKGLIDRAKNSTGYKKKAERKKDKEDAGVAKRAYKRGEKRSEDGKGAFGRANARRRQWQTYGRQRGIGSGINQVMAGEAVDKHNKQAENVEKISMQRDATRKNMTREQMLNMVVGEAENTKNSSARRKAAMNTIVDQKDAERLEHVQDFYRGQAQEGNIGVANEYNQVMGERYSDIKGSMAHLATEVTETGTTYGPGGKPQQTVVAVSQPKLEANRVKSFMNTPEQQLATQKGPSWDYMAREGSQAQVKTMVDTISKNPVHGANVDPGAKAKYGPAAPMPIPVKPKWQPPAKP